MRQTRNKPTRKRAQTQLRRQSAEPTKVPFIAHVHELRKRLFYVAVSVGVFAGAAYAVQRQLTSLLLKPAGSQQFIYTTPGGGFDFQFKLCLYAGIAASIPVIVYQLLKYINPLLNHETRRFLTVATICSTLLAAGGIVFGYVLGLPAAMNFLLQGLSTTKQIEALISIQSYMSFVIVYLLGTAVLFQIPLILIMINRIKPLQPRKLLKQQRWLIVISLVIGAIISPTPDIRNQLIFSLPIVAMYDLSVGFIWLANRRRRKPRGVLALLQKDLARQAQRLRAFEAAHASLHLIEEPVEGVSLRPAAATTDNTTVIAPASPARSALAPTLTPTRTRPQGYTPRGYTRRRYIS